MPDRATNSVLRRKLAPPRPSHAPGQGALQHLLAMTMPRDADDLLSLQLIVTDVTPGRIDKDALLASLGANDLIYLMKGEGVSPGLCTVTPGLLGALIEVQMSGRVSSKDPAERRPTPVDGVVASNIVDRWISSAKSGAAERQMLDRLPFAAHYRSLTVPDVRQADLALDPGEFQRLVIAVEVSGGKRTGSLSFAIPVSRTGCGTPCGGMANGFRAALMDAPAELAVLLTRLPQSLDRVSRLSVGDVLEIPLAALASVELQGVGGRVVARGRLGQSGSRMAVRIPAREMSAAAARPAFRGASPEARRAGLVSPPAGAAPPEDPLTSMNPLADIPDFPERPDPPQAELPDLTDLSDIGSTPSPQK